jgi:hypothetical protein
MNGKQISKEFSGKSEHDKIFEEIEFIQVRVKSKKLKTEIDKTIMYHFRFVAPLNDHDSQSAKREIFYDYKSMPDDLVLLKEGKHYDYCKKQCLKMAYYIKQTKRLEVLKMDTEFLVDDQKNVWFTYASKIHVRKMQGFKNNKLLMQYANI